MSRSEALKRAQKAYYLRNREHINSRAGRIRRERDAEQRRVHDAVRDLAQAIILLIVDEEPTDGLPDGLPIVSPVWSRGFLKWEPSASHPSLELSI